MIYCTDWIDNKITMKEEQKVKFIKLGQSIFENEVEFSNARTEQDIVFHSYQSK